MSSMSGVLLLIAIVALPSINSAILKGQNSGFCATNSECESSFCCLLAPSRYAIPNCMSFQQKGDQCRVNADTVTTNLTYPDNSQIEVKGIHLILCPCADGLSCDSKRGICN